MGRPAKATNAKYKQQLNWFSLNKYGQFNQLDSLAWYRQIQVRRSLYKRLTVDFPRFFTEEQKYPRIREAAEIFLSIIQKDPIIDFEENPEFELEIPELRASVHSTTVEEFYLAETAINQSKAANKRRFFDKAKSYRYEAFRDGVRLEPVS